MIRWINVVKCLGKNVWIVVGYLSDVLDFKMLVIVVEVSNKISWNVEQVYQLSIGAACGLSWPADRFIIQVLDDSTDPIIKV